MYASQSAEDPHARAEAHAWADTQDTQSLAAGGGTTSGAIAPHGRSHALSHCAARHALRAETDVAMPTGFAMPHWDRHVESPVQAPRQFSYVEHAGLAAHAVDSAQQWLLAHEAHVGMP
jgi:hypothetical protein